MLIIANKVPLKKEEMHRTVMIKSRALLSLVVFQPCLDSYPDSIAASRQGFWDSLATQGRAALQHVSTTTGINSNRIQEGLLSSRNAIHVAVLSARQQIDQARQASPDCSFTFRFATMHGPISFP